MIHSSYADCLVLPLGNGTPGTISRAQAIDPTPNTNFQRVKEIGRLYTVGYVRHIPSVAYRMTQFEYGSFGFWQQITNKLSNVTTITLEDFKTSSADYVTYLTDDDYSYRGFKIFPRMRTSGFS